FRRRWLHYNERRFILRSMFVLILVSDHDVTFLLFGQYFVRGTASAHISAMHRRTPGVRRCCLPCKEQNRFNRLCKYPSRGFRTNRNGTVTAKRKLVCHPVHQMHGFWL